MVDIEQNDATVARKVTAKKKIYAPKKLWKSPPIIHRR
jgi:hypothetical protein